MYIVEDFTSGSLKSTKTAMQQLVEYANNNKLKIVHVAVEKYTLVSEVIAILEVQDRKAEDKLTSGSRDSAGYAPF